ncbi:MAG TPA: DinB family protein [Myxococcota bacterium]|nr:DinB family protein [Myxococcota bacterium]
MSEKSAAIAGIRGAAERLRAECARASGAQWSARPAPDAWSVAHVAEHVAISNRGILATLGKRVTASPLAGRATDVLDLEIPYLFYRGEEPPQVATPTGDWTQPAALDALDASSRALLDWAEDCALDLRAVGASHPAFGLLDGIQWLLFAAAHMERHRAQVLGLLAPPHAPA